MPVGTYKNDKGLSFNYGSGTLYLGVETDTSDAIYLNPSSSEAAARPDKQIGFYIMSSSPELSYSEWEGAEPTDKLNSNRANLVFKDDKFNTAVPAAFHNTVDYGVKWSRSELQLNDDDGGTVLYIRIVQINTGKLLAVCKATITYDPATNSHSLTSLTDNNITVTGELDGTGESADDLAAQAVEYLKTKGGIAATDENWKKAAKSCIIEKVPTTYAFRFMERMGMRRISGTTRIAISTPSIFSFPATSTPFTSLPKCKSWASSARPSRGRRKFVCKSLAWPKQTTATIVNKRHFSEQGGQHNAYY